MTVVPLLLRFVYTADKKEKTGTKKRQMHVVSNTSAPTKFTYIRICHTFGDVCKS